MRQSMSNKLRRMLLALGALAVATAVAAPAYADNRHGRDEHHDRGGHRDWNHHNNGWGGGGYVGPSYGYYGYGYPPPPVYYPQPGFSINIPLDIH